MCRISEKTIPFQTFHAIILSVYTGYLLWITIYGKQNVYFVSKGGALMGHSRRKLDLFGQRFGKLTVIRPAENAGNRTAWLCRCDCGRETVVTTQRLRDGHRTSCGCDKPHFGEPPAVAGRASLTYVDGTCVEMIRANTRRSNNSSGTPGVDWRPSQGRRAPLPGQLRQSGGCGQSPETGRGGTISDIS